MHISRGFKQRQFMFPFNIRQSKDVIYRELVAFLDGMIYFVAIEVKMINTPENSAWQQITCLRVPPR